MIWLDLMKQQRCKRIQVTSERVIEIVNHSIVSKANQELMKKGWGYKYGGTEASLGWSH